jgi:hypothetical protein
VPPAVFGSTPLTEQDVIGLFHQLCALGVFPGIRIFATSQSKTYDSLVTFDCSVDKQGLVYRSITDSPLGVAPFVVGAKTRFETRNLTLEFKNNLDALVSDVEEADSRKSWEHIDICVCWSQVSDRFAGYEVAEVTEQNLEQRKFPGVTHLLHRDGEGHVIQVVMLSKVIEIIRSGSLQFSGE